MRDVILHEGWDDGPHVTEWVEGEYGHYVPGALHERYLAALEALSAVESEMRACQEIDLRAESFMTQREREERNWAIRNWVPLYTPLRNSLPRPT